MLLGNLASPQVVSRVKFVSSCAGPRAHVLELSPSCIPVSAHMQSSSVPSRRPLVRKLALVVLALVLLVASAAAFWIGPRNIVGMLRYDRRRDGDLRVGDRAPDVALTRIDGTRTQLLDFLTGKPLILIFGSYT